MSIQTEVRSVNPRTGEPFGPAWPDTSETELDAICEAAHHAAAPVAGSTLAQRAAWLERIADSLEERRAELVPLADDESGLGHPRLDGELTRTVFQLRFLAEEAQTGHHLDATISEAIDSPMGPLPDLRRTAIPVGPVAVFAASNFPFAFSVAGGDTASALAAGCPVVVKIHPSHPALSAMVAETVTAALAEAGAPAGTFAAVSGMSAGTRLVQHPAIAAAAFTGSLSGGRALFDLACSRPDPIPFYGELGSVNPVIVTRAAASARGADIGRDWVASLTLGAGQFCTKPGLILVPDEESAALADAATEAVNDAPGAVLLNSGIRDRFRDGAETLRSRAECLAQGPETGAEGFVVPPVIVRTTVGDALADDELLEEVFGPAGILIEYGSPDEVARLLSRIGGSLTVTVQGENSDDDAPAMVALASRAGGRIIWNGYPTGVAVSRSMQHGGPWPSTTSPRDTSVGSASLKRFVRAVSYQSMPQHLLPAELRG